MVMSARVNRVLDVAHKATVAVLATSAVYFTFEIFRVSWSIQGAKFEARQAAVLGEDSAAVTAAKSGSQTKA